MYICSVKIFLIPEFSLFHPNTRSETFGKEGSDLLELKQCPLKLSRVLRNHEMLPVFYYNIIFYILMIAFERYG